MSALNRKLLARKKAAEGGESADDTPKKLDEKPIQNGGSDEQLAKSSPNKPSSPFSTRSNSVKAPAAPAPKSTISRSSTSASVDDANLSNLREELIKVIRDEVQAAKEEIIEVLRQELRK